MTDLWYKDSDFREQMAYNRRNKLQLIIDIQTVTLENTRRGVTQQWVYNNIIYPKYRISRATYYGYLAVPAKRQLKEILSSDTQLAISFEQQLCSYQFVVNESENVRG